MWSDPEITLQTFLDTAEVWIRDMERNSTWRNIFHASKYWYINYINNILKNKKKPMMITDGKMRVKGRNNVTVKNIICNISSSKCLKLLKLCSIFVQFCTFIIPNIRSNVWIQRNLILFKVAVCLIWLPASGCFRSCDDTSKSEEGSRRTRLNVTWNNLKVTSLVQSWWPKYRQGTRRKV